MYQDCSEPRGFTTGRNNAGLRPGHVFRVLLFGQNTPENYRSTTQRMRSSMEGRRREGFLVAWLFGLCSIIFNIESVTMIK